MQQLRMELVGGPVDAMTALARGRVMPELIGLAVPCPGCGGLHPVRSGQYRRIGTPAAGYPGQFLWTPGAE
jgi:hypothetical protein